MIWSPAILLLSSNPTSPVFDLQCHLDPAKKHMAVQCSIDIPTNPSTDGKVYFELGDAMSVPKVNGVEAVKQKISDHDILYSAPYDPKNPLHFEISYESVNPQGFVYLLDPIECFAGGYNTAWFPIIGQSRKSLGAFTFDTPSSFLVKASGRKLSTTTSGGHRTTKFQIEQPTVPTFAAAPFEVTRIPGKVPVTLYMLRKRSNTEKFAHGTADILGVLQKQFGTYPFPDFSIIETPGFSSSLGFTGASFEAFMFGDSNNMDGEFNLAYYAHEMSHQWWGNYVGNATNIGGSAFTEGLAQYGSLQAVNALKGPDYAKRYRTTGYPNYSDWQTERGALGFIATGLDHPLLVAPGDHSRLDHELANSKGFLVWDTLARQMGRDSFNAGLQDLCRKKGWSNADWSDIFGALQAHTKMDLRRFRAEWFERPGLPTVWSNWSQDGDEVTVDMHQSEPVYTLSLPIVIKLTDGTVIKQEVASNTILATAHVKVPGTAVSVELDPDHEVLHSTPELNAEAKALAAYSQTAYFDNFISGKKDTVANLTKALDTLPKPDKYGAEFLIRLSLGGQLRRDGKLDEAKEHLTKALMCAVRRTDQMPLLYLRLALITQAQKGDVDGLLLNLEAADSILEVPSGVVATARAMFPNHVWAGK